MITLTDLFIALILVYAFTTNLVLFFETKALECLMDRVEELTEEIRKLKEKRWTYTYTFLVFWVVVLGVYVMFETIIIGMVYKTLKHIIKEIEKYLKEGKTC